MNSLGLVTFLLAQADAAADAANAASETALTPGAPPTSAFGWLAILVLVGVIVVPFVLGHLAERALKLKDVGFRIGVVLFCLFIGLGPFVNNKIATGHWFEGLIKYGIDLEGGTNLVYRVDEQAARLLGKRVDNETMDKMREAVRNRVAPTGTEEVTVRRVGDDRIEVIVPGADPARTLQVKRQITELGSLEFSVVVNSKDHPELYEKGQEQVNQPEEKEVRIGGVTRALWVPVAFDHEGQPKIAGVGRGELIRSATVNGKPGLEILIVHEPNPKERITGDYLVNAREEFSASGPVVGFQFNQQGGFLFQNLTWKYQPQEGDPHRTKLAIVLSGAVHSAPQINAVIGANGIIEGRFTSQEIQELINVLNAGALDVPLIQEPVNEATISPLLGQDVREQGMRAMWISLVSVFVVTAAYYWVPGLIADCCLVLNLVLLVGVMSLIDATFTLPGLAGLVLSIGMAVDANVLIFERMREETSKGASLRMAIQNGFDKALATIIDSNLTTLITAVVLYVIGTDAVKGFAVTLFIGIVISMFTAVYVDRLIFEILERKRWLRSIQMANLIGPTNLDFVGKTALMVGVSTLAATIGMAGVFARGSDNFDIDFRGGVMVAFEFEGEQPTFDQAQEALRKQFGGNISVESLTIAKEGGGTSQLIRLRTTDEDADRVSEEIEQAFADTPYQLMRQHVTLGAVEAAPPAAEGATADEFAGGQQATVEVTQPIFSVALRDEVASALQKSNENKYGDASGLLKVRALESTTPDRGRKFIVSALPIVEAADLTRALDAVKNSFGEKPFFIEKNTFATSVGKEMQLTALAAIVLSLGAIILYLWFRFHGANFGLAACVALVHDVVITLGILALCSIAANAGFGHWLGLTDFKINLPMIAAFLTLVGYSLNDTIVVFDRIREVRGKNPRLTAEMVNRSVNQTLSRTLLTSTTTLVVVMVLYAIGGEGIHGFAFCLFVGILVGTYSSVYVASPVLLWLMNREHSKPAAA